MSAKIGVMIKNARTAKDITQRQLAEELGYTTPQFVSNFERSLALPPPRKLKQIAKRLDLNFEQIKILYLKEKTERLF
jgi:transcriptional regulator with XRE-family HTH domain